MHNIVVLTKHVNIYSHLKRIFIKNGNHVMIVGEQASGKTINTKYFLSSLPTD